MLFEKPFLLVFHSGQCSHIEHEEHLNLRLIFEARVKQKEYLMKCLLSNLEQKMYCEQLFGTKTLLCRCGRESHGRAVYGRGGGRDDEDAGLPPVLPRRPLQLRTRLSRHTYIHYILSKLLFICKNTANYHLF